MSEVTCPDCGCKVQVGHLSMKEMRDELLSLAGAVSTNEYNPNVSKADMTVIYNFVKTIAKGSCDDQAEVSQKP